jgi:hypothetical protein
MLLSIVIPVYNEVHTAYVPDSPLSPYVVIIQDAGLL